MNQEKKVIDACNLFEIKGFLVGGIRPPTVPKTLQELD